MLWYQSYSADFIKTDKIHLLSTLLLSSLLLSHVKNCCFSTTDVSSKHYHCIVMTLVKWFPDRPSFCPCGSFFVLVPTCEVQINHYVPKNILWPWVCTSPYKQEQQMDRLALSWQETKRFFFFRLPPSAKSTVKGTASTTQHCMIHLIPKQQLLFTSRSRRSNYTSTLVETLHRALLTEWMGSEKERGRKKKSTSLVVFIVHSL